jgi:hypothetical protein
MKIKAGIVARTGLCLFSFIFSEQRVSGLQSGVWKAQNNVYVVEGDITVPKGLSLTLDSGVVVKFNGNFSLFVDGDLYVEGSHSQRVYFTSFADDHVGGDSNKDGIESGPSPLDWAGIEIRNAQSQSRFKNVCIQYCIQPLKSMSKSIFIDSLFLLGNSASKIAIGPVVLDVPENRAFSRALEKSPSPVVPATAVKSAKVPWYKTPLFVGSVAVGTLGAVVAYVLAGGSNGSGGQNPGTIPQAPGPPAN